MYTKYLQDVQVGRPFKWDTFDSKCNNFIIRMLCYLTYVDVYGETKFDSHFASEPAGQWQEQKSAQVIPKRFGWLSLWPTGIEYSDWYKRRRFTWLSKVLLWLYFLFTFHLLASLYCQYSYDFNVIRLMRLRTLVKQGLVSEKEFEMRETWLTERVEQTKLTLRAVGAPLWRLSILAECLYLYTTIFAFIIYYSTILFYKHITRFNIHFVRELLDNEAGQRHTNKLVEFEVVRLIESQRMFSKNLLHYSKQRAIEWRQRPTATATAGRNKFDVQQGTRPVPGPGKLSANTEASAAGGQLGQERVLQMLTNEHRVYRCLTRMLTSGALKPYNRAQWWARKRSKLTFVYHIFIFAYTACLFGTMLTMAYVLRPPEEPMSWADTSILAGLIYSILLLGMSTNLCATYLFVSTVDQVIIVNKIQELILTCIERNKLEFLLLVRAKNSAANENLRNGREAESLEADQDKCSMHVERMNANYLFVIIHYRIFVTQFVPFRRSVKGGAIYVTALVLLIPLLIKFHSPYANFFNYPLIKGFIAFLSTTVLFPANGLFVPVSHLYARCLKLYRVLSSLIAHTVEIESHPMGKGIYDQHALSLLFKELRLADQFMNRFKARFLGLTGNYNTLVKVHFWWGLVILSILAENAGNGGQELLSALFSDPLGVF